MRLTKFVVEGYRGFESFTVRPGDLTVVTGDGAGDLAGAARLFARLTQGWSAIGDEMAAQGATEAAFWLPGAVEMKLFGLFEAGDDDHDLGFGHEAILERLDGAPWWCIGYERSTRSNDFEVVDLLERIGDRVEYHPPRRRLPGSPVTVPARSLVSRIAGDMSVFNTVSAYRKDPRVATAAERIEGWSFLGAIDAGEGAPMRTTKAMPGFHGRLAPDGHNLVNVLCNVWDVPATRRSFAAAAREVILGFDALRFPLGDDGALGMELRTRDGRGTSYEALPAGVLRTLALYGALLSPEAPPLVWLDDPTGELDAWAAAPVADLVLELSRRTQVVVSRPSSALEARLTAPGRHPSQTVRYSPWRLARVEAPGARTAAHDL